MRFAQRVIEESRFTPGLRSRRAILDLNGTASIFEIRRYTESDAGKVGILIADTFGEFNLAEMSPGKRAFMLGPVAFEDSSMRDHREAIVNAISAPSVWVAEHNNEIIGVLRGGRIGYKGRTALSSLFVAGQHHGHGIGRVLVERFESEYLAQGANVI